MLPQKTSKIRIIKVNLLKIILINFKLLQVDKGV